MDLEPPAPPALLSEACDHSAVFPGDLQQVREARRFISKILHDHPRHEDAVLVTSEAAANAIKHTPSGAPDGVYLIRVWTPGDGTVLIAVYDRGAFTVPRLRPRSTRRQSGRGVQVFAALANMWGFCRGEDGQTAVWFHLTQTLPPSAGFSYLE
jgi:anti-sigma regulatory factor (Ser/Thr protein kinase)